jgi:hypothetical protein
METPARPWSSQHCSQQPNCGKFPDSLQLIKELRKCDACTHMVEYYSAMKNNEIILFADKRIELEIIMVSQVQKAKVACFLSYVEDRYKR